MVHNIVENRCRFYPENWLIKFQFFKKIEIKNLKKTIVHFKIFDQNRIKKNQSNASYKIQRSEEWCKNQEKGKALGFPKTA
jgi:hypothetical protein